ncbi:MAG: thioesterase family protein [Chitinophagaceae bacterium]|nr:thioesterase family protein [Chitinophagaceae bacterium]
MARIKLELPEVFPFSSAIPVRITDLNYGGHVGNDTILSIIHEARVLFLRQFNYTEFDMGGVSLIMADVAIEFRSELFYGDELIASVAVDSISRAGFDLYYKLQKKTSESLVNVALAKTGMVCFDYKARKVATMPEAVRVNFSVS